jgi:hypothetical protein
LETFDGNRISRAYHHVRSDQWAGAARKRDRSVNSRVQQAEAMLKGFHIQYTGSDHHIWQQQVDLDITAINNNSVTVAADFLLRDSSGNIDDAYNGWVQAVVVADTAANPQT